MNEYDYNKSALTAATQRRQLWRSNPCTVVRRRCIDNLGDNPQVLHANHKAAATMASAINVQPCCCCCVLALTTVTQSDRERERERERAKSRRERRAKPRREWQRAQWRR